MSAQNSDFVTAPLFIQFPLYIFTDKQVTVTGSDVV